MSTIRTARTETRGKSSVLESELVSLVAQRTLELRIERDLNQQLKKDILHTTQRVREQLGQELHADLSQVLAGASLLTIVLARVLSKQASPEAVQAEHISELLKLAQAKTRNLVQNLFPTEPNHQEKG